MTPIPDHPLKSYPVIVRDLRGKEDQFSLDKNGFMFMKHKSAVRPEDMSDTEKTTPIYTAECEEILKKVYAHDISPRPPSLPKNKQKLCLPHPACSSRARMRGLTATTGQEHLA